jgi:hypothetical protein
VTICDAVNVKPVFWQYFDDKFTSNNETKYYLGKMAFFYGIGKKGGSIKKYVNVIDFNGSNGKKMGEVPLVNGKKLKDFHNELLLEQYPGMGESLFDASNWFATNGGVAKEYYKKYVGLFLTHAILFENFILEGDELEFTRNVFLPVFLDVWRTTGMKPLIVALEPTDLEGDEFWMCYPHEMQKGVEDKIASCKN